ncbi:MAG: hypothetical protein WA857_21800 [Candidatus Acidiferrum sp.]
MDEEQLIFLGAAILLAPLGSNVTPDAIPAVVSCARALRQEVSEQEQQKKEKSELGLIEYYKRLSERQRP